jgi:hypothetical protein
MHFLLLLKVNVVHNGVAVKGRMNANLARLLRADLGQVRREAD